MNFPAFFSLLSTELPAPLKLEGTQLVRAHFDASQLSDYDFAQTGVPPVRGVAKRQAEHLAGRLCAWEALKRLYGQGSFPPKREDGAPQWPPGTCGSISHGAGAAAALVASSKHWQSLGLDLESYLSEDRAAKLAGEILTPAELQRAHHLGPQAFARLVTLTFSIKESLFKALYPIVLKRFYFEDAELIDWTEDGNVHLRLLLDLSHEWPAGREIGGRFADCDGQLVSIVAVAR